MKNNIQLLHQAEQYEVTGDISMAEAIYQQIIANSESAQKETALLKLTKLLIVNKYWLKIIRLLEPLLLKQPRNVVYCRNLADAYSHIDNWQEYSFLYHQQDPNKKRLIANAFYSAAYITKQENGFEQAVELYNFALNFNIDAPEDVHINLAVIYSENLRMESKAVYELKRALAINKNHLPALYNLAGLYEEAGDRNSAVEFYQRILSIEPSSSDVLVRLSACLSKEDSKNLIIPIKRLLDEPNRAIDERINLYYALGKILDDSKKYQHAFAAYEQANILESSMGIEYAPERQAKFVDENINLFSADWFSNLPVISTAKPVFICGMFRSGSTLLEQILSAHENVTAGGELNFFNSLINKEKINYPSEIKSYSQNVLEGISNQYLKELSSLFPEKEMITDKRPDNFLYIGLIKSLFPHAQIIHTCRQPVDNCLAVYFQRLDKKLNYATNLLAISHYYQQQEKLMQHWKNIFPDSVHVVNYEDLISDVKSATAGVFKALDLDWQEKCYSFFKNENNVKTASIWQVRQPLHKKSCRRWLNYQKEVQAVINFFS